MAQLHRPAGQPAGLRQRMQTIGDPAARIALQIGPRGQPVRSGIVRIELDGSIEVGLYRAS
jgi:hypothetical protein